MSKSIVKAANALLGGTLLMTAQPALADGGLSAYVTRKTVQFVVNFLSSAASNANVAAAATATSKVGTDSDQDQDTGFFSATAQVSATSGNLAATGVKVFADYNFIDPHEIIITPGPNTLTGPTGLSYEWYANASIKGIWQILLESIPSPFLAVPSNGVVMGEVVVPLSFQFDLNSYTSYDFALALEFDDSTTIDLVSGTAGAGGASILFPYLESSNPMLASALRSQYLGAVAGKQGNVSLTLGQGLLPPNDDGVTGLSVPIELGRQFRLNSALDGDGAQAIPEPASWAMLIAGFGLVGAAARRRRAYAAASPFSGIA